MRKKKVLVLCPSPDDATSFYRGFGPFGELERSTEAYEFFYPQGQVSFDWTVFSKLDVLFFQRPCKDDHLKILMQAKQCGVKIWVDFDDDLMNVHPSNPVYSMYAAGRKFVAECMKIADVVTVSTESLRESISFFNKNTHVIPNAFNERFCRRIEAPAPKENIVLWRGSATHAEDLRYFANDIVSLAERNPSWTFCFFGYNPWFITERMRNAKILDAMNLPSYFEVLQMIKPKLQLVTLTDNRFNRAKSNIAWIEGSFAGSAVMVPGNMPEWQKPGMISWDMEGAELFMRDTDSLKPYRESSWDYIQEHLLLSDINRKRLEVLCGL